MKIVVADDYKELSILTAKTLASQIFLKPDSVLGLATGSTPTLVYRELIRMHEQDKLDFAHVVTFNLDEYLGIDPKNENSYHYYMQHNFFNEVNIPKDNIYIPDGQAEDIDKECKDYEMSICKHRGIDIQILGIGQNGHIGFNEPDVEFEAATHTVKLNENTIKANARFFKDQNEVPKFAISMGIKTIMNAKKILLLANGETKVDAIYHMINDGITSQVPASILQLHPDVTVLIDEAAAERLDKHKIIV
ncbi:glucosamine-6-phosphate deaminase [Pectinatus frisingensis]|uniref:glucosamine-6-phosphate deaminase n=1 Tax=Pectinatus frisingensis TaxID=865 RepID=UPI003D8007B3